MALQGGDYLPADIFIPQKMLTKRFFMSVHFTKVADRHLDEKGLPQNLIVMLSLSTLRQAQGDNDWQSN